jgi:lysine-specific demethylase 8
MLYLVFILILILLFFYNKNNYGNEEINLKNVENFLEFNNYLSYKNPFIITDQLNNHFVLKWDFQFFKKIFGKKIVKITQPFNYDDKYFPQYKNILLEDYINLLLNNKTNNYLKYEDNNQFFQEINLEKQINQIFNNITPLLSIKKTSFWMGPKNSWTPLHYDTDYFNLLCMIKGYKEIILIHPKYTKYIYQMSNYQKGSNWSYVDIWNIDYIKYPLLKNIKYNKIILKPGQMLYIPPFYWHAIRNIDNTIAFTYHYYTIYSFLTIDIPDTIFYMYNKISNLTYDIF